MASTGLGEEFSDEFRDSLKHITNPVLSHYDQGFVNHLATLVVDQQEKKLLEERDRILREYPCVKSPTHQFHFMLERFEMRLRNKWYDRCSRTLTRLETRLALERARIKAAFAKFDFDSTGSLDVAEFHDFVRFVGLGKQVADEVLAKSGGSKVTLESFTNFLEERGGLEKVFEQRRQMMKGDSKEMSLETGARVSTYYRISGGRKSNAERKARVVKIDAEGGKVQVHLLAFAADAEEGAQWVPKDWISHDLDLELALDEIGVCDDAQLYWTMLLPESESGVVKTLVGCQKQALSHVRALSMRNHQEYLPKLLERCKGLGINEEQVYNTLVWVRDFAPMITHLDLNRYIATKDTILGRCLLDDTLFKNLFDVKTGGGCTSTGPRKEWERHIFGPSYDEQTKDDDVPSMRPKYGVLDVCNDPRGVVCAYQYGDSYMVLRNVRLRSTFASCDTGNMPDLAVLDQQAKVLYEYRDSELKEVSRVACAPEGSPECIGDSEALEYFNYKEAEFHGLVELSRDVSRVVVNTKHRDEPKSDSHFGKEEVEALCRKHGWELSWMDKEKSRRITHKRQTMRHAAEDGKGVAVSAAFQPQWQAQWRPQPQ